MSREIRIRSIFLGSNAPYSRVSYSRGFTLLELLIVIALLAIVAVVVILVLNPAETLRRARDSQRMSDLGALHRAVSVAFNEQAYSNSSDPDGPSYMNSCVGESSQKIFMSVPSDNGETAPGLPSGWTVQRVPQADVGKVNGSGWMPVDLTAAAGGSPLSNLPVDPTNTFASNLYYTYTCSRNPYIELTARMESANVNRGGSSDRVSNDAGDDPFVFEIGTNVRLDPMAPVAHWSFDDGSGTAASDTSGNGNNGTLTNFQFDATDGWRSGADCIKGGCVLFDGANDFVNVPDSPSLDFTTYTQALWFKTTNTGNTVVMEKGGVRFLIFADDPLCSGRWIAGFSGGANMYVCATKEVNDNQWRHVALTFTSASENLYLDGALDATRIPAGGAAANDNAFTIGARAGGGFAFPGTFDEILIYDRSLSAAEVRSLYNLR